MTDAELQQAYQAAIASRGTTSREGCPPPEDMLALVERRGTEEARLATLDHAMSCTACHEELALLKAINTAQPRQAGLMPRHWLAAAGLLIALTLGTLLARGIVAPSTPDLMRGEPSGASTIPVVGPTSLASGAVSELTWRRVPNALEYVAEVLDADGKVLFAQRTTDTTVAVPALATSPSAWWVRARLGDGSEKNSGLVRLKR